MASATDIEFMKMALALAARGLGNVAPNPAVGCVIVKNGIVVGRGWTQAGGRPHAETEALKRAGAAARGATAYVTLEPCAHHGKTPPCAEALIAAGVARVVGAVSDPDPRVAGRGFAMLDKAGIAVEEGVCEAEARRLNEGFFLKVLHERPLVTLKVASSADGRIATHAGQSQWITGELARARGQLLRATHDAIMVGSATAIVDDPRLTCRLPGLEGRSPIRIVADGRLRLPLTSKLVQEARDVPVWILTLAEGGDASRRAAFRDCGVELIDIPAGSDGFMDMVAALKQIAQRGVTRLLVEGGARLAASLMRARLVDRVEWFRSSIVIGGDGTPAIAALGVDTLAKAPALQLRETLVLGDDTLSSYLTSYQAS
ncbi:MAG: bifunctional diaminohydroxyphosphoribosylaminopyrimidine deaminase/5-amino-6-(5-phosphoribosylamino)uracil reductase RibD [Parvibaculum sp.]|uniref:bifunctional diaminohydroxyphosphoribosylaminopyrimidine deaminase/5-amino-6-(5-phosphoribosylamino)uracil reductase RibD n=1 Tax=Parvibaculum sp. TaxID=2024848 RepID=UPI00284146B8|nr:bifunctional diaminohydroxyphosphoribosylaminopyrimidine deaminase/5-amino-6-(5-phosphoribosylamino)uracil reductase RibD [Parvibaculum sp.]MDR3500391.1 bifunctional diaminohydroxyphosphoribosylaminopyrimidine deaminase/5-amino-6-(5-phosphoribosylamino)uracil reductase RibD [Parvibaculum sp.]